MKLRDKLSFQLSAFGAYPPPQTILTNHPSQTMRYQFLSAAAAAVACVFTASAQVLPGAPETNGVTPKTATAYVNGANTVNNLSTESLSIDLAGNGNLIVGWEDDGSDINSLLGVWTLLDPNGVMITPQTVMTNRDVTGDLATFEATTNQFLSFFRSDNTATPGSPRWLGSQSAGQPLREWHRDGNDGLGNWARNTGIAGDQRGCRRTAPCVGRFSHRSVA